jgi:hypothetical protein
VLLSVCLSSLFFHRRSWSASQFCGLINPFTAEVAIMRLLGSTPWSHLCMRPEKEEQSDSLVWLNDSFHWPRVFILQTDAKSIQCFQKHAKLIENRYSRSKVQLTRVWELLTRCWNASHWESHCVFTAGGERFLKWTTFVGSQSTEMGGLPYQPRISLFVSVHRKTMFYYSCSCRNTQKILLQEW